MSTPKRLQILGGFGGDSGFSVQYVKQALTDEQKAQALENLGLGSVLDDIANLMYEPIAIESFNVAVNNGAYSSAAVVEIGTEVKLVHLSWKTNKIPTTLLRDDIAQTVNNKKSGTFTISYNDPPLTSYKSWTVKATDERDKSASKNTSVSFYRGVYHGAVVDATTLTNDDILNMTRVLSSNGKITFTGTTAGDERLVYVCPTSYGTPTFTIGVGDYSWNEVATIEDFTNASGHVESYTIWQEPRINPGTTSVTVKFN